LAFTFRNRRLGYDNIAAGSAAGIEFHNTGASYGEKTSNESNDGPQAAAVCREYHVGPGSSTGAVSDSNLSGHNPANPTSIVDITPTSETTPGYTSQTSWTTVQAERVGWTSAIFP